MPPPTNPRTFIVRVSQSPQRVIVEDVRHRRRAVTDGLESVGAQIGAWMEAPLVEPGVPRPDGREDSVSPAP